jgi:AbiV family abortive infection protein
MRTRDGRGMSAATVSTETLLHGSWYALEHAGRLFQASVAIFKSGDVGTALALAMFGREQMGQSSILLDLGKSGAQLISAKEVQGLLLDHATKQKAGAFSDFFRADAGTQLDALMRKRMQGPRSPEYKAASDELDKITKKKRKHDPGARDGLRMRGLYVDLRDDGRSWDRPNTVDPEKARNEINEAVNDYTGRYGNLQEPDVLESVFPELARAQKTMNPKPELPPPPESL